MSCGGCVQALNTASIHTTTTFATRPVLSTAAVLADQRIFPLGGLLVFMSNYKLNMNTTRVIHPINAPSRRRYTPHSRLPKDSLAGLPAYTRGNRSKYKPDGLNRRAKEWASQGS